MLNEAVPWPLQRLVAFWRTEFDVYRATDADAAQIRLRHMQSIGRLTPLMMVGNMVGGLLLVVSLQTAVPRWQLMAWLATLFIFCGSALANWWRHRNSSRTAVSPRAVTRTLRGAVGMGLLWAGATAAWFAQIQHDQQLLLSTLVIGMMCGGAFALASVPQAAFGYIVTMTAGSVIALAHTGGTVGAYLIVMALLYAVLLVLCVLTSARIYNARLVSEREARQQGEWLGLLLRDFEEHSADLLWEVGRDGRFTRTSARLAAALSSTGAQLHAAGLLEVLARHAPADQAGHHLAKLAAAMAEGRPFRDRAVPVQTAAGPCWWSLTAKPLRDTAGQVIGWRGVIADVTPARRAHDKVKHLAHSDSLTGLANRLQLRKRLQAMAPVVSDARAMGRGIALICLNVDHFKSINDTLGHAAGDAVLIEVARRLQGCLRQGDLAARLDGDEFAVLVDQVRDEPQARGMGQRLMHALCQPCQVNGHAVTLSVSVGVVMVPEQGVDHDELLVNASLALQAAKQSGRGRFELFTARLGEGHRRRVLIAQELRSAIAREELALAWQPQVAIDGWTVTGAEALLRWHHPQLGQVSPAEFIPIAEESGQIIAMGTWVLEQACAGAAELPASISVSVNASPAQLLREDFVAMVGLALARSGLPARRLKIEITESLLMDAVPVAVANLHGLRAMGVQIALDDFGTGFSSLAYLLRFPFDVLKIDRAFVLELMARDDARVLVRSIVEMARSLGMGTIAEGVEDKAQLEVLRQAGCEAIQGYLVAKPMPLAQLHQLLAQWCEQPDHAAATVRQIHLASSR